MPSEIAETQMSKNRAPVAQSRFFDIPDPPTVYHYTSAEGLAGILTRSALWLSDCAFLNDKAEQIHADALLLEIIARSRQSDRWKRKCRATVESFGDYSTLAASFSEDGDLLSQWRAYCPPEGGYAIGFAAQFWRKLDYPFSTQFRPCVYNTNTQRTLLRNLVRFGHDFELFYRAIRPCIKNASFSEEREVANNFG